MRKEKGKRDFKKLYTKVRILTLENANAKCKGYFAFQAPKCIASGNAIAKYCKFFCNTAIVQFYF